MGRKVDVKEIVGVAEIASRLDREVGTVHSWRRRFPDFPQPVAGLNMGLVWVWPDVEAWARKTGRLS